MARRAGGAYGDYGSDDSDSDDSGFDEGLSSDEFLLARISKMRDMMSLNAPSTRSQAPPAAVASGKENTQATASVQQPPPQQPQSQPVKEVEKDEDKEYDFDEFMADKVASLSMASANEQRTNAPAPMATAPPPPAPPVVQQYEDEEEYEEEYEEEEEEEEEDDDGYAVTWARGQLGILFKEGPRGETVIRRVNKKTSSAEGLHLARTGDVLVAIDGVRTRGRGFQELVEQLRLPNFPVTLAFQPLKDSDSDEDDNGGHAQALGGGRGEAAMRNQTYQQPQERQQEHHVERASDANNEMMRKQSSASSTMSFNPMPPSPSHSYSEPEPQSPFAISQAEAVAAYRLNNVQPSYATPPMRSSSLQYAAPYTPTAYDNDHPPGPDEYDVTWHQGSLGCGVKPINGMPTIKSVTPGAAVDPSVRQIAAGDVMIWINGSRTETLGFRGVVEIMQRAPKPVYMRFRRAGARAPVPSSRYDTPPPVAMAKPAPSPSRHGSREIDNLRESRVCMEDTLEVALGPREYTVLWKEGSLGVQIKTRPVDGAVIVSKFTGTGDPVLCAQIQVGDVFVRIAGVEVANLGISGTHELLRTVQKPIVVVFERQGPLDPPPQYNAAAAGTGIGGSAMPQQPPPEHSQVPFDDANDPRESTVPSFRVLRERQAAMRAQQPQLRGRESFSGFSPDQRGDQVFGAAGRRAAHDKHRPASYDNIIDERHSESSGAGPSRHNSFAKSDHLERSSDKSYQSGDGIIGGGGTAGGGGGKDDSLLPRFSDIEAGRVQTTSVSVGAYPPPPAYLDVFTESGRELDMRQFMAPQQQQQQAFASPRSDDHAPQYRRHGGGGGGSGSVASSQGPPRSPSPYSRESPQQQQQQQQQLNMSMQPYMQPPPSYDQHLGNPRSNQRVDVLRQQYIQAERVRNTQPPSTREPSLTQISSYSDLDDSGVMAAYRRPKVSPSSPLPPPPPSYSNAQLPPAPARQSIARTDLGASTVSVLPPPELWIQWSEGPLGITFRRTNNQIVVSRLTGAGYSQGLEQLRPGDWLVSFGSAGVGSYATSELRLSGTMELIKSLPKPVDMCFIVR